MKEPIVTSRRHVMTFCRGLGNFFYTSPSTANRAAVLRPQERFLGSDPLPLNSSPAGWLAGWLQLLSITFFPAARIQCQPRSRGAAYPNNGPPPPLPTPGEQSCRCRDTASRERNNKPSNGVRNCGHSASDWMQSCCGSSARQFRPALGYSFRLDPLALRHGPRMTS